MIGVQLFAHNTVEEWRYGFYRGAEGEDLTYLTFVYTQKVGSMEDWVFKKEIRDAL